MPWNHEKVKLETAGLPLNIGSRVLNSPYLQLLAIIPNTKFDTGNMKILPVGCIVFVSVTLWNIYYDIVAGCAYEVAMRLQLM